MNKVTLNLSERMYAIKLINEFKGDIETLSFLTKDLPLLSIEDAEFEKAERYFLDKAGNKFNTLKALLDDQVDLPENERGGSMKWDDTKDVPKEIEFSTKTAKYLVDAVDKKSKEGLLTLEDSKAVSLKNKLEA